MEELKKLGRKIALNELGYKDMFTVLSVSCKHRLSLPARNPNVVFCGHEGNKHFNLNYAGCFYNCCPHVGGQ